MTCAPGRTQARSSTGGVGAGRVAHDVRFYDRVAGEVERRLTEGLLAAARRQLLDSLEHVRGVAERLRVSGSVG